MGECIFENAGNFTLDSYQTKKKLPRAFGKSTGLNQEFFGTQSNNYFIYSELDHFDQILQKHYEEPTANETIGYSALDQDLSGPKGDKKSQLNLRQVSCQLLHKLQEKRVNLVLVATSLDENDVVQKLKSSLDPETYSMIPLSFDESNNTVNNQVNSISELASIKRESNTDYAKPNPKVPNESKNLCSKKTTAQQKDEKYWKRRTSNNEAARRSREAKRAHFIWIQNRTKELEVENANLHKELKNLEQKMLEREKKVGE